MKYFLLVFDPWLTFSCITFAIRAVTDFAKCPFFSKLFFVNWESILRVKQHYAFFHKTINIDDESVNELILERRNVGESDTVIKLPKKTVHRTPSTGYVEFLKKIPKISHFSKKSAILASSIYFRGICYMKPK